MSAQIRTSPWKRLRAPLAAIAAVGFLGVAVFSAPLVGPSTEASADELAFQARIHQQFVPNESASDDLVYTAVDAIELPDPEVERKRLAAEAEAKAKAEAEAKADSPADSPEVSKYSGGGAPAEWMAAAGIAESDWGFVDYIASAESGWNPNATNASSGACGLIQAYPCSKVPGNGYNPVDNLRWASGYAVGRYGSWADAVKFWQANHWW